MLNVYIGLDRSGSMITNWNETLGSLNGYLDTLREDNLEARVTIVAFDSVNPYELLRINEPLETLTNLSPAEATPRGNTPLWDTAGRMIADAEIDDVERTVLVFITDGQENGSREFTRAAVKASVARIEERGWQVVFLGADFDTTHYTDAVGLSANRSFNMTDDVSRNMGYDRLRSATIGYATKGTTIDLSDEGNNA